MPRNIAEVKIILGKAARVVNVDHAMGFRAVIQHIETHEKSLALPNMVYSLRSKSIALRKWHVKRAKTDDEKKLIIALARAFRVSAKLLAVGRNI